MGRDQRQLFAVANHTSCPRRSSPGEGVEELGLAVPLGTCDSHHLARFQGEADRTERLALKAVDHQHLTTLVRRLGRSRKGALEWTAHDQLDQLGLGGRVRIEGAADLAVAEHGYSVGDLQHLGESMADIHHPDSAPPAGGNGAMESLHLVRSQSRRGLVEEKHLGIGDQRFGHLEHLALGKREKACRRIGEELHVEVELAQQPARPFLSPPVRRPLIGRRRHVEVVLHRLGQDQ